MTLTSKTLGTVAVCALLSACGGGGGGGDGPRTVFTNQPLDSRVAGDSSIAAAGFEQDGTGRVRSVRVVTGSLDRPTQDLDLEGLIANATQNADGSWTSGDTTVAPTSIGAIASSDFAFLTPVRVTEAGGNARTYLLGVVSRSQDLPDSGSVVFTGSAEVTSILAAGNSGTAIGRAVLTANFGGTESVDVLIDDLVGGSNPFSAIEISGLATSTRTDATFESTSTSTFDFTGGPTNGVGDNSTLDAAGAFFGGTSSGPTEAGGAFLISGDDGDVFGIFAADTNN